MHTNSYTGPRLERRLPVNTQFGPYTGIRIDFANVDGMDTSYMWEVIVLICSLVGLILSLETLGLTSKYNLKLAVCG